VAQYKINAAFAKKFSNLHHKRQMTGSGIKKDAAAMSNFGIFRIPIDWKDNGHASQSHIR
jgi:hypothetical protein